MEKAKPTILFLHGALGTKEDVLPLMELIQERGFSTYSFNFSGHGVSKTWPVEFRIDLFARDLEKFIHDHNLKDLVVFGYSMGGYVALYHMANYEDSPISHIFTYGTKFNWSEKAVSRELPMLNPENLEKNFPQQVEILKKKHGDRWKSLLHSTAHMMQNQERLDGLTRQDMEDITIPVTLMLGDQDRSVTSEEAHLTATWLHQNQVKVISHSKHELERSNLREIATIILDGLT